jgi:hypothetical protein
MRTGFVMQQQHPFSEEAWSLPENGGTIFVRIMHYEADVLMWLCCWNSMRSIPWRSQNNINMTILAGGVTLNFMCAEDARCFHCLGVRLISGSMVHPRLITSDDLG